MNELERRKELRRQRALDRLGTNYPRCVVCGLADPHALELHHVGGRKYDDLLATLCRNDHRILSNDQKDHDFMTQNAPENLQPFLHLVLGIADLLIMIGHRLREFVVQLFGPTALKMEQEP